MAPTKRTCLRGHDTQQTGRDSNGYCRECFRIVDHKRAPKKREKALLRKYGITEAEYQAMLKQQNGVCAICGKPEYLKTKAGVVRNLTVDHCHKSGKVRSLLCSGCNYAIGTINEDPKVARAMAIYLDAWDNYLPSSSRPHAELP